MVSRLNDAILLTREMVKQRWNPMAVAQHGARAGTRTSTSKTLGKLADGRSQLRALVQPEQEAHQAARGGARQGEPRTSILNTNHVYTFEALLIAADAFKRAGWTDPKALADAIRATNITDNVSSAARHPVQRQGPERRLKSSAHPEPRRQADGGRARRRASNAKPELPMQPYDKR